MDAPNSNLLDSDEEDDDFVPQNDSEDEGEKKGKKRTKKQDIMPRRKPRRGGIILEEEKKLLESEDEKQKRKLEEEAIQKVREEEEKRIQEEETMQKEAELKKKLEAMWEDINKDGGTTKPAAPNLVTVTETYDFAGEEIKISKQVSADQLAKSKPKPKPKPLSILAGIAPIASPKIKTAPRIDNILDVLNDKKKKMSTLDKSRLDWEGFKVKEGITEELDQNKKSGYLEKSCFLTTSRLDAI